MLNVLGEKTEIYTNDALIEGEYMITHISGASTSTNEVIVDGTPITIYGSMSMPMMLDAETIQLDIYDGYVALTTVEKKNEQYTSIAKENNIIGTSTATTSNPSISPDAILLATLGIWIIFIQLTYFLTKIIKNVDMGKKIIDNNTVDGKKIWKM